MNTQEFEQAKREFAQKWCPWSETTKFTTKDGEHAPFQNMLSDLTALLEQHKEVMMEFAEWLAKKELRHGMGNKFYQDGDNGMVEFITAELFDYWLKNVKK